MLLEAPRPRARCVEVVPPLLVMLLNDAGKLPHPPSRPSGADFGFVMPTLKEMQIFTWIAEWEGTRLDDRGFRKVAGYAAYRDTYDLHTCCNVRELSTISGSRRAVYDLVNYLRLDARREGRRLVGGVDATNASLLEAMKGLGGIETRAWMEDA